MDDIKHNEPPKKPDSTGQQVLWYGVSGFAVGAAISAALGGLSNWAHNTKFKPNLGNMLSFGADIGFYSAIIGWFQAKSEHDKYDVELSNYKLKQQVSALEEQNAQLQKSFVKALEQPKEVHVPDVVR